MWTSTTGQHREDLKQTDRLSGDLKDQIFQQQLMQALARKDQERANPKTYAETVDRSKYTKVQSLEYKKAFTVAGDDKYKSKKWESMMKDAAFYLDNPQIKDEVEMRKKLQYRYDSLFSTAMRPPLQSRKDLVTWTCQAQNAWMQEKEAPEKMMMDCTNYN